MSLPQARSEAAIPISIAIVNSFKMLFYSLTMHWRWLTAHVRRKFTSDTGSSSMTIKTIALLLSAAASVAISVPAAAQTEAAPAQAVVIKKNMTLTDAEGRRLGKIFEADSGKDYVTFLSQMKIYRVPVQTISNVDGHLVTSLTKAALGL